MNISSVLSVIILDMAILLIHHKSEALQKFKEYKAEAESLLGKTIKMLYLYQGGEYIDLKFQDCLIEHEIKSQPITPSMT